MALMKFITENAFNSPYDQKYKDDNAIADVIGYVCNPEKTDGYIGSWSVDPCYAAYEMELLAKLFHNDHGVRLRHWIITFTADELRELEYRVLCDSMDALYVLGGHFSVYYKDRYQILYAVHGGDQPHLHFVMNTVSYVDGKKFSGSKRDYYQYEKYTKNIAHRAGITLYIVKDHAATKYHHS